MEDNNLSQYQSEHLILLVGGNPLPNAVAGSCLLAKGGMITLIYSKDSEWQTSQRVRVKAKGTEDIAKRLRRWFIQERKLTKQVHMQAVDDADAWDICNGVRTALRNGEGSVGLHYSGGTKAIAIHAYRTVQEETKGKAVFSYLNPRTLEMFYDVPGGEAQRESVGTAVNITLEEMLFLQTDLNLHRNRPYLESPLFPQTAQEMMRVYVADGAELEEWKMWISSISRRYYRSRYDGGVPRNWKPASDIYNDPITDLPPTSIGQTLLNELGQPGAVSIEKAWRTHQGHGWTSEQDFIEEFLGFLTGGKWLEHYTLDCLQSLNSDLNFHQTLLGVVPARANRKSDKEDDSLFEVDVVAIRGYQLLAFSCGIGKKGLKMKLFEAEKRARQLGGDEARIALVCLAESSAITQLEQEVKETIDSRIKIFGKDDLLCFRERLQDWIESQIGR